jgi:leader peptidase (prepilin peptidase)/N-methyltransferase
VPTWVWWTIWFAWGACIGSFLNVNIYRLPREQSIVWPSSRCPHCHHAIAPYDNIPLVSWIVLRGRCRNCRVPIGWRYPLVEALGGVATVAVLHRFGLNPQGLVYVALVHALIVVSFIDLEFQIIPDEISLGGLVLGVLLSAVVPSLHGTTDRLHAVGWSVLGVLVGGGVLLLTGLLGDFLFKKESLGGGDVKLLAMAGAVLGWKLVAVTFLISPVLALIPGVFVLLFRKSHVIPYGPFLSLGLVIALFFGEDLIRVSGFGETFRLLWEIYGPAGRY